MFDDIFAHFSDRSYLESELAGQDLLPEDNGAPNQEVYSQESEWLAPDSATGEELEVSLEEPITLETQIDSELEPDFSKDEAAQFDVNLEADGHQAELGFAWETTDWYPPESDWHPSEFDGIGNPVEEAQFWQQQEGRMSCAVVAQRGILESLTGVDLLEAEVCQIAEGNGWFDPETGTHPEAVGNLLNQFGIPTQQSYDATLEDIADALEQGNKVIVGLDANEVWTPLRDSVTHAPIEQTDAGHAVWVTGIDAQPDGSVKIILNDSGIPDGQMKAVDAEDFLNAWSDHGNFTVVAYPPKQVIA